MERFWIPFFILLAIVLQTTLSPHLSVGGVSPDLVLLLVIFLILQRPGTLGLWLAFGIGLLEDIASGTPLGLNALVLLVLAFIAIYLRKQFFKENYTAQIIMVILFTGLHQFLSFFSLNTLLKTSFPFEQWVIRALGMSLYHAILTPWIFRGLSYFIPGENIFRHLISGREPHWRRMG